MTYKEFQTIAAEGCKSRKCQTNSKIKVGEM